MGAAVNRRLLLDNSAWARLGHPSLAAERVAEVADALEAAQLVTCAPFLLEAGYSARSPGDHDQLLTELLSLPRITIDERTEDRALDAQRQLARAGHHRLPPVDLLIAALADRHQLGVLHYGTDFDRIDQLTDLRINGEWLAERGSL